MILELSTAGSISFVNIIIRVPFHDELSFHIKYQHFFTCQLYSHNKDFHALS